MGQESISMSNGFDGDDGRSFSATLTPTPMNQNSFSFWVVPSFRSDKKTMAAIFPADMLELQLTNLSKIGSTTSVSVQYDSTKKKATTSGTISQEDGPKGLWRSVPHNYDYYSTMIHKMWSQSGGVWNSNSYKITKSPVNSTRLWRHLSRPLTTQLMDVNKFSLNLGAELLLLAAGFKIYGGPVNYEKALRIIDQCLKDLKVSSPGI